MGIQDYNTPTLNLASRHRKGVMTTFGVLVAPFYRCNEVAAEGALVVLDAENPGYVKKAVAGSCPNGVFGILASEVYDPSVLGELSGVEFFNNTKTRKGNPVGVIIGQGYVETLHCVGTIVAGEKLYVGASAKLTNVKTGSDKAVGVAETSGTGGTDYIRVRVNLDFAVDVAGDSNSGAE